MDQVKPSTGYFGSWGIVAAVKEISSSSPFSMKVRTLMSKTATAEVKVLSGVREPL